ncbi:IS66 family transposase [Bacteroidia bacterium]|nr:IS66 family transposase [Bacteroidia bacterium]GHV70293.1 IS66 family transposase [Bacteroidia bacterium]
MELKQENNAAFIQALLEERDRLYRETAKLKTQIKNDFDATHYQNTIQEKDKKIQELQATVDSLQSQVESLKRKIWGKSSERFISPDPQQRRIDFEGLDVLPEEKEEAEKAAEQVTEYKEIRVKVQEKKKPVRVSLPEFLPRVEEHVYPENIDTASDSWTELPSEITEVLVHKPAEFYVRRIVRHVYVLKNKSLEVEKQVVTAPMPILPIARSYADATLLAELMINKYVNHLPYYRQIQMFKQSGVSIPPSTINDWFKGTADLLRPMYYRLKETVLATDYLQVDETTLPIIDNEKHKAIKGYLWMIRAVMENTVFFHYDNGSRAQTVAIELLKDYQGALQTDGYEVYKMYENKQGVLPIGCWAHARRYVEEALKEDKVRAEYALEQIGMLYEIERMADEKNLSYDQRAELRSRLAYPILVVFEKWVYNEIPKVLPKGRISKALKYIYHNFHRLSRYHLDGRFKIDNNLAENAIRPVALGRKNYLFCGNHSAAEDAAVIYSLLACCKAADVNYRDWMVYVLDHIHDYDTDYSKDLAELLPAQWKASKQSIKISECL